MQTRNGSVLLLLLSQFIGSSMASSRLRLQTKHYADDSFKRKKTSLADGKSHPDKAMFGDDHRMAEMNMAETRIVGGSNVPNTKLYPWFVQGAGCGGSLVAPDIVLTAAHCVHSFMPGKNVRLKSLNYNRGGLTKRIHKIARHPSYISKTNSNDVMLVKIDPVTTIKPIALNSDNYVPRSGQAVKVMGYGAVNIAGNKYPTKMKHVDLKAQSHKQCAKAFRGKIDKNTMLCAAARRKDSCYGDSGGPLITTSLPPVQVGIVSWGPNNCGLKAGVYSRVSGTYDWIRNTMCSMTSTKFCGPPSAGSSGNSTTATGAVKYYMEIKYDLFPQELSFKIFNNSTESEPDTAEPIFFLPFDHFSVPDGNQKFDITDTLEQGKSYHLHLLDGYGDGFKDGWVQIRAVRDGNVIWTAWSSAVVMLEGWEKIATFSVPNL